METSCKVNFIGVWDEDVFTDEVMKTIAAYAQVEKGKKVKLTLAKEGIKVARNKMFQENLVKFYPYAQMRAVTKNPRFGLCIMFIMDGTEKKYRIMALRCPSESNAIYIVNRVSQFKDTVREGNVEFKKRENGNWTLRERSAHNANMHLREIFAEQEQTPTPTTTTTTNSNGDTTKLNGDVHYVPVLDKSKAVSTPVRSSSYIKRNGTVTRESVVVKSDEQTGEIHAEIKDDGIRDASDLEDLMDHVKVADAISGLRRGSTVSGTNHPAGHASTLTSTSTSTSGPVLLRAGSKTYDARVVGSSQPDPFYKFAAHRRVSGDFILPARLDRKYSSGNASMRGSMRVQFDSASVVSVPRKTMSMRLRPSASAYSTSTTIQRSIEDTYSRPVVIQHQHPHQHQHQHQHQHPHQQLHRRMSGTTFVQGSRHQRPSTVHVMRGNQLRVYQAGADIAL